MILDFGERDRSRHYNGSPDEGLRRHVSIQCRRFTGRRRPQCRHPCRRMLRTGRRQRRWQDDHLRDVGGQLTTDIRHRPRRRVRCENQGQAGSYLQLQNMGSISLIPCSASLSVRSPVCPEQVATTCTFQLCSLSVGITYNVSCSDIFECS